MPLPITESPYPMAHTKQARKRIRQDEARNASNTALRSTIRTAVKKAEQTIESGDKAAIPAAFKNAMSLLYKGAQHGVVSAGAASRKVSRLAARIAK